MAPTLLNRCVFLRTIGGDLARLVRHRSYKSEVPPEQCGFDSRSLHQQKIPTSLGVFCLFLQNINISLPIGNYRNSIKKCSPQVDYCAKRTINVKSIILHAYFLFNTLFYLCGKLPKLLPTSRNTVKSLP